MRYEPAGFFFAEMTIGPMWALPMDIAPDCAGTASGASSRQVKAAILKYLRIMFSV